MVDRLLALAGSAEDLHVLQTVGSTECEWDNVVDIPELTGRDFTLAGLALPSGFEEEIKPRFG